MPGSSTKKRRPRQLGLALRTWGGKRPGSGRKPTRPGAAPHTRRPALASRFPVHVTLKVDPGLADLRESPYCNLLEDCLRAAREGNGFRLVHYSIQNHHLHLLVEAVSAEKLARGMQGLAVRMARRLNREMGRKGRVFVDRYFARILRTPRQTRAALCYVINNVRRHAAQRGERVAWNWVDDRSSGAHFDGWTERRSRPPPEPDPPVARAGTWLLAVGWRRHGLISINAVPGELR